MAYLLDTVAALRWWGDPSGLGPSARAVLEANGDAIFLSAVSVWEIANKNRIGKLPQVMGFEEDYPVLLKDNGFASLSLTDRHAMRAGYLPGTHRDPFDRLIAGQALVDDLTVLTNDSQIAAFGCKVLW
ncbi:type II toxin-antitoxin system VapC family toxin [Sphingomonas radiodurans]|uniref:type II toxin-antitoxin system VapC family toxin n=1 Tax=Sphingomonas radiodurans TaxID=2890321 RepID=UPI001E6477F1|nr:type II toxin-antitoxin system VapC family toxin [Sphingomonas radiodurans]WBH15611.1 type II toxin-antitoxin system VapC family toxin [Sphingomonas radiodurans]